MVLLLVIIQKANIIELLNTVDYLYVIQFLFSGSEVGFNVV